MRTFLIEYMQHGELKAEILRAPSAIRACKLLADKVRKPGYPVALDVRSIREVKL